MTGLSHKTGPAARAGKARTGFIRRLSLLLLAVLLLTYPAAPSLACGACATSCEGTASNNTRSAIRRANTRTRMVMTASMKAFQLWTVNDFFIQWVLPSMRAMASQLTVVGMEQVTTFGAFLDAKHQLETQRTFDVLAAQAHKDYRSSMDMCTYGTAAKDGLGGGSRVSELVHVTLSKFAQDRQTGNLNGAAAEGRAAEKVYRLELFKRLYCNPHDDSDGYSVICPGGGNNQRWQRDIDFGSVIGQPGTVNVDFLSVNPVSNPMPAALSADEEDVLAIARNLFAHDVFERLGQSVLASNLVEDEYFAARSVIAKRSVAFNSFAAYVGLKAASGEDDYLRPIMMQNKTTRNQAGAIIGSSFYGRLKDLSQKMYQDPEFYSQLYDSPANVMRKGVAMQAIALMVDRTAYKSELRTEALLAVLLEMELLRYQQAVQNRIGWLQETGRQN